MKINFIINFLKPQNERKSCLRLLVLIFYIQLSSLAIDYFFIWLNYWMNEKVSFFFLLFIFSFMLSTFFFRWREEWKFMSCVMYVWWNRFHPSRMTSCFFSLFSFLYFLYIMGFVCWWCILENWIKEIHATIN